MKILNSVTISLMATAYSATVWFVTPWMVGLFLYFLVHHSVGSPGEAGSSLFKHITLQGLWVYSKSAITYQIFCFRDTHHWGLDVTSLIVRSKIFSERLYSTCVYQNWQHFNQAGYSEKMPTYVLLSSQASRECEWATDLTRPQY